MDGKKLYTAIEQLNKEKQDLLTGKEFKLGKVLYKYSRNIINLRLTRVYNDLKRDIKTTIITSRLKMKGSYSNKRNSLLTHKEEKHNNGVENYRNSKIAVYTCILGDYDKLLLPLISFENVDMYIFTDSAEKYESYEKHYKIVSLAPDILCKGYILANRYVKLHPKEFLNEYDFSIYLDGNIRIISDIRMFTNVCSSKLGIAMHRHRNRACAYDEAQACLIWKRGATPKIKKQILDYKNEGFPSNFGLNEAGVIATDLNNPNSVKLLNLWWEELIRSESLRDQIAWPYVLWKNGYQIEDVGSLGSNLRENYKLEISKHY